MKKVILLLTLLISSYSFSALKVENDKISDNYKNSIKIKEYNRIVILDPAIIETFYMIGAEDKISAIATTARSKIYPEDKVSKLPSVGHITNTSIEKILSFSPDLVLIGAMSTKLGASLKPFNIPVLVVDSNNFDDILQNIQVFGKLTGKEKEATKLYEDSTYKLKDIQEKISANPLNLKGAILYSTTPMMAFNSKSLSGQILSLLGIKNLADNLVGDKPIISPEFLLKENPDFLIGSMAIGSPEDILNSNPVVKDITAGKKGHLFIVDSTKILRGSPRIFEAIDEFYNELKNF
ncbi:ABC transporter substrate-binding protein [Fusobacterium sp.]|uniref:ABC transporter substrate-binding protein n=1 Tax=Fusobacterium sp. TaxID=68766 RepID=UPI0025BCA904|nr:ABC transporter substrate-binding protein [Fusobacterium sp.]